MTDLTFSHVGDSLECSASVGPWRLELSVADGSPRFSARRQISSKRL